MLLRVALREVPRGGRRRMRGSECEGEKMLYLSKQEVTGNYRSHCIKSLAEGKRGNARKEEGDSGADAVLVKPETTGLWQCSSHKQLLMIPLAGVLGTPKLTFASISNR